MNIQEILAGIGSSGALASAAGNAGLTAPQAHATLQSVAEHVDGGGGIEGMAEAVAAKVGITPDQVRAFLPYVLPLLQQHAQAAPASAQGGLGALLGSLGGVLGGTAAGGSGLSGIVDGLFSRRE